jgi:CubicO group peptidase (beta-lactamase class C family)
MRTSCADATSERHEVLAPHSGVCSDNKGATAFTVGVVAAGRRAYDRSVDRELPISGSCPDEFWAVRDAFVANFVERGEVGGAVCVMIDGEVVIDLVGGWSDAARTKIWRDDTLVNIYSAGKGVLATLALQLIERGQLVLDDRVGRIWDDYGCGGKEDTLVRHALAHLAGVPAIRVPLTNDDLWDWERMTRALAGTEVWFEPGTRVVYHTNTYGHLVGEIIRRTGGRSVSDALRALAATLGSDIWCAVPPEEQSRCAEVIFASPPALSASVTQAMRSDDDTQRMIGLAYLNPPGYGSANVVNTSHWRGAQIPAANVHATARSLAQVYAALLVPNHLVSSDLLAEATRVQAAGDCPILGEYVEYGLGFVPTSARRPMGTNPRTFGHFGTGGAVGFGDPDAGVAFGYVMNQVVPRWQSSRNRALIDSVYRCLREPE